MGKGQGQTARVHGGDMQIFRGGELSAAIDGRYSGMRREIDGEPANRLLNVNEAEYVEYLVQKYRIDSLVLLWEHVSVSDTEKMIRAEAFPFAFNVYAGKSYPKQVVTYHIPFAGDASLLGLTPSTRLMWSGEVDIQGREILFDIVNWRDNPEEIKREADQMMSNIRTQAGHMEVEVAKFNNDLPAAAEAAMRARKQLLLKQSSLLESLGTPITKSNQTPATFAVPTIKRKVVVKPTAPDTAYAPEPTLDDSMFQDILRLCRDTGVEMERHPSIYADKNEETLRDHFIMVLSPHFDSVTGETFNRGGKTDILVRHESSNVFVAECKFWSGPKGFAKAIDQLLGYLTWRDSKAAIVLLVPNREFAPVLDQIQPVAEQHPCWISTLPAMGEGWFNFNFHLIDDATRGVKLAVLCFHLPSR